MKNTENNKQKRSSLHLRGTSGAQEIRSLRSAVFAAEDALILPTAKRHDDKCSGRSMIEMLGVLAIIGVLSVGGIAGYSKAMMRVRVNKTIDQITYMAGAFRTFFAPQKNYRGVDDYNVLKKAGLVPDDMWETNSSGYGYSLGNVFGGSVLIFPEQRNDDSGSTAFSIFYRHFHADVCIELATQDWTTAGVGVMYINGDYLIPPVSVDKAITLCNKSDNKNDIGFSFDTDVNSNYWKSQIDSTNSKYDW